VYELALTEESKVRSLLLRLQGNSRAASWRPRRYPTCRCLNLLRASGSGNHVPAATPVPVLFPKGLLQYSGAKQCQSRTLSENSERKTEKGKVPSCPRGIATAHISSGPPSDVGSFSEELSLPRLIQSCKQPI